jgi:putative redox protein
MAETSKPPNHVRATWTGDQRFDAGRPGGPTVRIDGTGETGPGPVDTLLIACATCTAIDVVEILNKRRTPVASLEIDVTGTRFEGIPRRLTHIRLVYRMAGAGIERGHAERAIDLALNKYCSVRDSLDPKIPIEWTLELRS